MVVGSAILGPQVLRCFSQTAWRLSHPAPTFLQTCENQLDNSMGLHETRVPNMIQYPTTPFIHENNILYIYIIICIYIYTVYLLKWSSSAGLQPSNICCSAPWRPEACKTFWMCSSPQELQGWPVGKALAKDWEGLEGQVGLFSSLWVIIIPIQLGSVSPYINKSTRFV